MKPSLTILVPAYREAENLKSSVNDLISVIDDFFSDYEILIIDCLDKDGKDDGTAKIAEEISISNPKIKAIHNSYVDLGYKFWQGVSLAKMEYITWFPGDGENDAASLKNIFGMIGSADIIISYTANMEIRSLKRRIISRVFNFLINAMFNLRVRYYTGLNVFPVKILRDLPESAKKNTSFSYSAEVLVRLLKKECSYKEVGIYLKGRKHGNAKALSLANFWNVIKNIRRLFWELQILRKNR